jgi:RNA polymerase sigma-70 factor (ECF subfamily)
MACALENFRDEELATRARAGSAACFEEIMRRYQVPLIRFLDKRFPSRRDSEDILQDTFVRAWQALHRYDEQFSFRTWIYTIAYRLAVSRGRQDGKGQEMLSEHEATREPSPASSVEREEVRQSIWDRARTVLSEEQYTAMWLFYVDEVPAGEVARILDRSWVSVKTLLHRARKKLAPVLAEFSPAPPAPASPVAGIRPSKAVNGESILNDLAAPLRPAPVKAGDL